MQRLIKQWGKEQVVNVNQRASLHRAIGRLHAEALISVRETGRDRAYPERTVYELTDAGREVASRWLQEMPAVPKQVGSRWINSLPVGERIGERLPRSPMAGCRRC
ncbi:PadR family transcriptional regulator [Sphaerisporangium perillae]|uniref:PadR family transcriptional regulator n=1 Tax=Sphaerisporangium perillae TaxID=2935860 RepID=UPI00200C4754|nr:helix-turn-helix transcriptional regulator [Sphaerisporangium perillae]